FLLWLRETNGPPPISANLNQIYQGRLLYHQVGCVACHAPQEPAASLHSKSKTPDESFPAVQAEKFDKGNFEKTSVTLANLAHKITVPELARFLMNPLGVRPSGRMPSLNLAAGHATAIAMYLLREQSEAGK